MTGIFGKVQEGEVSLEIRRLGDEHIDGLIKLYEFNKTNFEHFFPHPFTKEAIAEVIETSVLDLYYVVVFNDTIIGYGMLRGMDEGYDVPSLGIAVDKAVYGTGVAVTLMEFLETTSRLYGYKKMRLRVFKANPRAYNFYIKLGYTYEPYDEESVLGFKEL